MIALSANAKFIVVAVWEGLSKLRVNVVEEIKSTAALLGSDLQDLDAERNYF